MADYVELFIDQGTTFSHTLTLADDMTNANANVMSYSFSSQMRRSFYSTNATANITCTITDGANGEVTISMTAAQTANIKPSRYLFDVRAVDEADVTTRILEGIITITPSVTR